MEQDQAGRGACCIRMDVEGYQERQKFQDELAAGQDQFVPQLNAGRFDPHFLLSTHSWTILGISFFSEEADRSNGASDRLFY